MTPEPTITINGTVLTGAEAMTLRNAVSLWQTRLADPAYRRDLGEPWASGYSANLASISRIMHGAQSEPLQTWVEKSK